MTTELAKKSRWANEAIGPARAVLGTLGRALVDLPSDVTPGARSVAQLTALVAAQKMLFSQIEAALAELRTLSDWSGGFLVADTIQFDWRTAPFKHYASFDHFYHAELAATWKLWTNLQTL